LKVIAAIRARYPLSVMLGLMMATYALRKAVLAIITFSIFEVLSDARTLDIASVHCLAWFLFGSSFGIGCG
jgi:hypothetical protein